MTLAIRRRGGLEGWLWRHLLPLPSEDGEGAVRENLQWGQPLPQSWFA